MPANRTSGRGSARIAAIILAAGALAACSTTAASSGGATETVVAAQAAHGGPVAVTGTGLVQGKAAGATDEFLGIPYAAPPTGSLRWAPPQPAAHWSGTRDATSFAPHCPQSASPFGQASTSEDCLFLNVFRPAHGPPNRPVMVWIHGGALVTGESNDYDPANLVPPVTAANYVTSISNELGLPATVAQQVASEYPVSSFPSAPEAMGAAGTDAVFACPALAVDLDASKFVPVHAYEFNDENAPERFLPPLGFPYGAAHASEIQYLFGIAAAIPGALTADQQKLAAAMRTYWTDMALLGTPNLPVVPFWPAFSAATQQMISLVPPQPQTERGFAAAHHCAFWASLSAAPVHN